MSTAIYELRGLADVKAPEGFADRVLAQVGAADSYAVFETVLGPVYVAWSRFGVSAAMRSKSAAEFEQWFRKDIGRHLVRVDPPADLATKIEDQLEGLEKLAHSGLRYEGVRSTKIFCFPTCFHGRRVRQENFVFFHDEREARAAGYRPCKDCRPAVA